MRHAMQYTWGRGWVRVCLPFVFEPYIFRLYGNEAGLKIRLINYLWFLTKSKQTIMKKNLHEPASYILSPFLSDPIFLSCGPACPGVSRTWQAKPQRFSPPPSQTFPEKSRHQVSRKSRWREYRTLTSSHRVDHSLC